MAGYCHLPDLQTLIVGKLKRLTPIHVSSLLSISQYIYTNNPGSGAYREYFLKKIKKAMMSGDVSEAWAVARIREGGDLAEDLYRARKENYDSPKGRPVLKLKLAQDSPAKRRRTSSG